MAMSMAWGRVIGLFTLIFLGLLVWRRDWVGCTGVALWSLFISWLIAGVIVDTEAMRPTSQLCVNEWGR